MNDTEARLTEAKSRGKIALVGASLKEGGPGFLQSAITLGGGSLAGSLFLGTLGGYQMLWVQPLAMMLGLIMLAAIAWVTLSIGYSPFEGIRRHINPVLAWAWLGAALFANMVWIMAQYALAYGAVVDNLFPSLFSNPAGIGPKLITSLVIFAFMLMITLSYGSRGKGIVVYETVLKSLVGLIVLAFIVVVVKLSFTGVVGWRQIFSGFVPDPSLYFRPVDTYQVILDQLSTAELKQWWTGKLVFTQREQLIGAASVAVGINMTFLLPFSLLAKRWTHRLRGFAIFDLSLGMFLPFTLAISCIMISAAALFHGQPYPADRPGAAGKVAAISAPRLAAFPDQPLEPAETQLAAMLVTRDNADFANSLGTIAGPRFAQILFGVGVLAMALSTISIIMLICGFCFVEAFGFPHGGRHHKWGTLIGATGVLWPLLWFGTSKAYLAVIASVFGYILLPIAFITFFLMMNSSRLMGDHRPRGTSRWIWNLLMGVALTVTVAASTHTAWHRSIAIGDSIFPAGRVFLGVMIVLIIAGFFMPRKDRAQEQTQPRT